METEEALTDEWLNFMIRWAGEKSELESEKKVKLQINIGMPENACKNK